MNHKKYQPYIITVVLAASLFFISNSGIAQKIKLNPIKPASQSQILTDEQQAIAAVRMIKPAVVDILGFSTSTIIRLGPGAPLLQAQPSGVKGTGIIIGADGLIVSNNHVVEDPKLQYFVMFADGAQYEAKILGRDQYDDVALLKIEAKNLPVAKLGDSDALETGQTVFAIGNTLGKYQNTVSRGVISGLGRAVDPDSSSGLQLRLQRLIQTDAAISQGNSGGPLINMAGEVVGMNTIIDTAGSSLSFAVPVNVVKQAIDQLQRFGQATRPYLGVKFMTLSRMVALTQPGGVTEGAYISEVVPGSPAGVAGIKSGDVIVAINQQKLNQINELDKAVAQYQAGNQVVVTYVRDGKSYDVTMILGNYK